MKLHLSQTAKKLAFESVPIPTQRDAVEHRVWLCYNLADVMSTKSPADRALLNGQLVVVPVPNREQLTVESIQSQTQQDEEKQRAQPRHDLASALSKKLPGDWTLLSNHLKVAPVLSREQLAVGPIPS